MTEKIDDMNSKQHDKTKSNYVIITKKKFQEISDYLKNKYGEHSSDYNDNINFIKNLCNFDIEHTYYTPELGLKKRENLKQNAIKNNKTLYEVSGRKAAYYRKRDQNRIIRQHLKEQKNIEKEKLRQQNIQQKEQQKIEKHKAKLQQKEQQKIEKQKLKQQQKIEKQNLKKQQREQQKIEKQNAKQQQKISDYE